jgi:quercetin dioxygenase-like cupin family protein
MENTEQEKGIPFIIPDVIDYIPHSVVIKTILKKNTGIVTVSSFEAGEALAKTSSPFDKFVQVIEGKAEIIIDGETYLLNTGQSIIIPAHARNTIKANERFKMISTVVKSGYESF